MSLSEILADYRDAEGNELSDELQTKIVELVTSPTEQNWANAHLIIMRKHVTTLWDLVCKVDESYPREYLKDNNLTAPDANTVLRALKL